MAEGGAFAPQLWPIEASNGLLTAERCGRITPTERRELAHGLSELPIAVDTETASQVWSATQAIAEAHRLTAYDAAHLELAVRLGAPLATRDKRLAAAAKAVGAPLVLAGEGIG